MELQHKLDEFKERGLTVVGISYDPVEVLRTFSDQQNLRFSLLSDVGSRVIRTLGLLNTELDSTKGAWGSAFPGLFIVDKELNIVDKQFEISYYERSTAEALLVSKFGKEISGQMQPFSTGVVDGYIALTDSAARRSQIVGVQVQLELKDDFHVYARPTPQGYFPLDITFEPNDAFAVDDLRFPEAESFRIEGLDEKFFVYSGQLSLHSKLRIKTREAYGDHVVRAKISFQACNDKLCLPPRELVFEFPLKIVKWDKRVVGE